MLGLHLGMSGRVLVDDEAAGDPLLYASNKADPAWHRFGVTFADGGTMFLRDPRRLGAVELDPDEDRLGPDAFDLTLAQLRAICAKSRAPIKAVIMDQSRIAGLGNLLCDEALWRAGIDPARPADELADDEVKRLHRAIRDTLADPGQARWFAHRRPHLGPGPGAALPQGRRAPAAPHGGRPHDLLVPGPPADDLHPEPSWAIVVGSCSTRLPPFSYSRSARPLLARALTLAAAGVFSCPESPPTRPTPTRKQRPCSSPEPRPSSRASRWSSTEVMFGLPGGAILPVYDPLIDSSIRHILVRHEQGAGHMAEGYAHATGRPGVAMVTSGPAATNIVTPLCDAIHGLHPARRASPARCRYAVIGTDAFQEADTVGITMPITKHNWLITDADDIPRVVREAFHVATTGRPGPVLVDMPKDVANQTMDWYWPEAVDLPGYKPSTKGHPKQIKDAARLIGEARAPGDLRRRRHPQGPRRRGAARAGRAHRHPRGHHADGPGRLPRRPRAVPRHARHARQLHRDHRDAAVRPADRARGRASTTA